MADFTPGPWSIDGRFSGDGGSPFIDAPTCWLKRQRMIAQVLFDGGSEDPEVHANARLIAAAPEMYEALANLEALLNRDAEEHYKIGWPSELANNLRQYAQAAHLALAKARGETT